MNDIFLSPSLSGIVELYDTIPFVFLDSTIKSGIQAKQISYNGVKSVISNSVGMYFDHYNSHQNKIIKPVTNWLKESITNQITTNFFSILYTRFLREAITPIMKFFITLIGSIISNLKELSVILISQTMQFIIKEIYNLSDIKMKFSIGNILNINFIDYFIQHLVKIEKYQEVINSLNYFDIEDIHKTIKNIDSSLVKSKKLSLKSSLNLSNLQPLESISNFLDVENNLVDTIGISRLLQRQWIVKTLIGKNILFLLSMTLFWWIIFDLFVTIESAFKKQCEYFIETKFVKHLFFRGKIELFLFNLAVSFAYNYLMVQLKFWFFIVAVFFGFGVSFNKLIIISSVACLLTFLRIWSFLKYYRTIVNRLLLSKITSNISKRFYRNISIDPLKIYTIVNRIIPISIVMILFFYLINGIISSHQIINLFFSDAFNFWLLENFIKKSIYEFDSSDVGLKNNLENVLSDKKIDKNSGFIILSREEYSRSFLKWLDDAKICKDQEDTIKLIKHIINDYFSEQIRIYISPRIWCDYLSFKRDIALKKKTLYDMYKSVLNVNSEKLLKKFYGLTKCDDLYKQYVYEDIGFFRKKKMDVIQEEEEYFDMDIFEFLIV